MKKKVPAQGRYACVSQGNQRRQLQLAQRCCNAMHRMAYIWLSLKAGATLSHRTPKNYLQLRSCKLCSTTGTLHFL